jgi:hypothetical protein
MSRQPGKQGYVKAVYGRNPILFAAGIVLGIGHIGIHLNHQKEVSQGV